MRQRMKKQVLNWRVRGLLAGPLALVLAATPVVAQTIGVGPPPDISVVPGGVVDIPIEVDMSEAGGQDIASLQFEVSWDPGLLTFVSTTPAAPAEWVVLLNEMETGSGVLGVGLFSTVGTTNSFTTVTLKLQAANVPPTLTLIDISVTAAGDAVGIDLLPIIDQRDQLLCIGGNGLLGDVTDDEVDEVVNIIDAQQVARHSVGLETPNAPNMEARGDVNEDGKINIIDAQQIARFAVGLDTPLSPNIGELLPGCDVPSASADLAVFNDINIFVGGIDDPNNQLLVRNLVVFSGPGPRVTGAVVWFDRGRNSVCGVRSDCDNTDLGLMRTIISQAGLSITDVSSTSGSITSIPADVKVVFLWNPTVPYTPVEINTLKQFAAEGGRIVFIGEWDGYYGALGLATENQFLMDMGAQLTNTGGAVDCGFNVLPASSLRPHQIMLGLTQLTIACASVIDPGPNDFPLFYDLSNTQLLGGVALVDVGAFGSATVRQREFDLEVRRLEALIRARYSERPELDPTSPSGLKN